MDINLQLMEYEHHIRRRGINCKRTRVQFIVNNISDCISLQLLGAFSDIYQPIPACIVLEAMPTSILCQSIRPLLLLRVLLLFDIPEFSLDKICFDTIRLRRRTSFFAGK